MTEEKNKQGEYEFETQNAVQSAMAEEVDKDEEVVDTDTENSVDVLQTLQERTYRMTAQVPPGKENKLIAVYYLGTWLPEARCREISPQTPILGTLTAEEKAFYSKKYIPSTCRHPSEIRPLRCTMSAGIHVYPFKLSFLLIEITSKGLRF